MKHTPGPWFAKDCHVWAGSDPKDGAITWGGCGCCSEWDEGVMKPEDARLIAAAPELLEALKTVLAHPELIYTGAIEESLEASGMHVDLVAQIKAAIAKAEGQ